MHRKNYKIHYASNNFKWENNLVKYLTFYRRILEFIIQF